MPLIDDNEAINIGGLILAMSANRVQRSVDQKLADGTTIGKVVHAYHLTVTIETTDEEMVRKLTMVRMRQQDCKGPKTADLLVWPIKKP